MKHIAILGGGIAGLAVGYYAQQNRFPITIYEAAEWPGGGCATERHDQFFFDLGAHRFHDKIGDITNEIEKILGEELQKIHVPSVIFHEGRVIRFPLSPLDLLKKLGPGVCLRIAREIVCLRRGSHSPDESFADYATQIYGQTIASAFLLNYTEKLYGKPCSRLSPAVAGERLKGLNLWTFISEAISKRKFGSAHMDGGFYYPKQGIGAIADRLSTFCGRKNIHTLAEVTRVVHDHERIKKVEINGKDLVEVEEVVSTLPLDYFLRILDPVPPPGVMSAAESLSYRSLLLVGLFLNRHSVTPYATIYFPEARFPQTRTYEPRNRSPFMSPPGKTCLISEIPCQKMDDVWNLDNESAIRMVVSSLLQTKWITRNDIFDATVMRLGYAYPILDLNYQKHVPIVMEYLAGIQNLRLSGRHAQFRYTWIHNLMDAGKEIVCDYLNDSRPRNDCIHC